MQMVKDARLPLMDSLSKSSSLNLSTSLYKRAYIQTYKEQQGE